MDHLFNIMSSRNPFGKGFKAPLKPANKHIWLPFLNIAYEYLQNLRTAVGVFLYKSKRKTPTLGYLLMIDAVKSLFQDLLYYKRICQTTIYAQMELVRVLALHVLSQATKILYNS